MVTYEELEDAQARGMRTAGVILLITAGVGFFSWAVAGLGYPAAALVDVILGTLLLRMQYFWKPVVLVRAGIGLAAGVVLIFGGVTGTSTHVFALVVGGGQLLYCLSLILLLFDTPTPVRVRAAQVLFAASILMTAASVVVIETGPSPLM